MAGAVGHLASIRQLLRVRWLHLAGLALATTVHAEVTWERVDDHDGVVLWRSVEEQPIPTTRATVSVDAPLCDVLAVVRDVARFCDWMADCVEVRELSRASPFASEAYLRIRGEPWLGVDDRDVVLSIETRVVQPRQVVELPFVAMASSPVASPEDVVRMPRLDGSYRLSVESPTRTAIDYRFVADLGGSVPGMIAKRTITKLPVVTLTKLRDTVARRRGSFAPAIAAWPPLPGGLPCVAPSP